MTAAYVLVYSRDAAICDINRATETGIEMKATSLKKRITALVLAVSVVVTGYAQETKVEAPVADPQIKADQIQKEVAELRGLPFKRNVKAELQSLTDHAAILALGNVAHAAVLMALGLKPKDHPFGHGARHILPSPPLQPPHPSPSPPFRGRGEKKFRLYDSYHCSRYNTQTKRLTGDMFRAVFSHIKQDMEE